jgi:glycine cleavage system H protein
MPTRPVARASRSANDAQEHPHMAVPNDRKYSQTHEWFRASGDTVTIGVTQFAADELTDITFVDLPKVGAKVSANTAFGEIESVKATADLKTSLSGEVLEINKRLADEPGLVNSDPFGEGWMIRIRAADLGPLAALLDGPAYDRATAK